MNKLLIEACNNIMFSNLSDKQKADCLLELVYDKESLEIVNEHIAFLNITEK